MAKRPTYEELEQRVKKLENDAFDRKRAEEALQERNRQLRLINQSGRILNSSLDLDHVLTTLLEEALCFMDVTGTSIWLKDTITGELVCRQAAGLEKDVVLGWRVPKGEGVAGWVAANGKGLIVKDTRMNDRHFKAVDREMGLEVRSILSVPVEGRNGTVGALQMVDTEVGRFDERHLEIMTSLAAASAIAIENASLYGQAQNEIHERKLAEKTLRQSEEKYRTILESIEHGYFEVDIAGNCTFSNDSLCEILGYSKDELKGMNNRQYTDAENAKKVYQTFNRVYTSGKPEKGFDWELIRKDGSKRYVEASVSLRKDPAGQPIGFRGIALDVSERRMAEEQKAGLEAQLQQSQKMEAIGRLAGGVAHDFNNLLTTIIGYADIMLMKVDKESALRTPIEEIRRASDRAANLTRQLLAFSRKQMIHPVMLELNYPLAEMDKMLRRLIGEDIDLITVLEPKLWQVRFDPGQMDQVIMNLAVNARDAMPQGGKLTIETANVDLDATYTRQLGLELKPGPFVMIAVSDTGFGMEEETRSHIFEPFFTTKEKGKGTGLGLSMTYGIIKQHGGSISVYSEPGLGTTFKIYLPKAEAEEAFKEEEQITPQNLEGSETILLAEDEDSARGVIRSILQEYGYRVLEAQDGKEALQLIEQHEGSIHLLLTDVMMPEMNGRDLAERLQSRQPEMKVLYMSGYTDNAIVRHGILESGMPFIQKPFAAEVLASNVREILDTCRRSHL